MIRALTFTRGKTRFVALVSVGKGRYTALIAPATSLGAIARAKKLPRRRQVDFRFLSGGKRPRPRPSDVAAEVVTAIVGTQLRARRGRLTRFDLGAGKKATRRQVRPPRFWLSDDACTCSGAIQTSRDDSLTGWTLDILNADCKEWLRQQGCDMSSYAANYGVDAEGYVTWEVCECGQTPPSTDDPGPPDDFPAFVPIDLDDFYDDIGEIEDMEVDALHDLLREDDEEDEEDEEADEPTPDEGGDGDGGGDDSPPDGEAPDEGE